MLDIYAGDCKVSPRLIISLSWFIVNMLFM